ncbi:MAG: molybdate ABC transporter substrate-binding protein [Halomonadaceae bacterium]|nr:MAG: molybdate ABC transporter substrate-binding protein [Halomonadaceae bacterium]
MVRITVLAVCLLFTSLAQGQTRIAVASNFEPTAQVLADNFFDASGERLTLVEGGTEQLAQQIRQDVGFAAFISGDKARVEQLLEGGMAVEGTDFVYATGRLVLLADNPENEQGHGPEEMLREESYLSLAIPHARESAYGEATAKVLDEMIGSRYRVRREVQGNSSAQTFQFLRSGSVDLGFVPLSLVIAHDIPEERYWLVPDDMHDPLEQAAVLIDEDSEVARKFLEYMQSDEARQIILDAGYE